jgi:hypothetical protein
MMQVMKDIGGVEVPEYFVKLSEDGTNGTRPTAVATAGNGAPGAATPPPPATPQGRTPRTEPPAGERRNS